MSNTDSKTSLVTTVLNDLEGCRAFFEQMALQSMRPDEIVIVDGGSKDGTWEFLQSFSTAAFAVKASQDKGCNVARGRNLAIEQATHDIIVSTDVGCQWSPEWYEELARPLIENPDLDAVMGSWMVRSQDLGDVWSRVEFAIQNGPKLNAQKDSHSSSRAISYRKSLWKKIGGYPEDLTLAADDMVYALLLHATTTRTVGASIPRCFWERPQTLRRFCREAERNFFGAGEAGIWADYGVYVGGRLAFEAVMPILGVVLALVEWFVLHRIPLIGPAFILLGLASAGLRLLKMLPAIQRFNSTGRSDGWWRVPVFEYATKYYGIRGYWRGRRHGAKTCTDCRRRLRDLNVVCAR